MTDPIVQLRRELHRHPELSGGESATAARMQQFLGDLQPDELVAGLGGRGLAAVFAGADPGPTVLLRCELDALPIEDQGPHAHRSAHPGVGHQCGHDGHMAILAAVASHLAQHRPRHGRVVLLFQPAEETGEGAAAVVADPRFASLRPDWCFALHNVPGYPLGQLLLREGAFSCASRGMSIELIGKTAHAAQPETGLSPAPALCRLIAALSSLPAGLAAEGEICFATVVGAKLGEQAFGTAPGQASLWVTLRSERNESMQRLVAHAEALVASIAGESGLRHAIAYQDVFPATCNAAEAIAQLRCAAAGRSAQWLDQPFRWSEDFGHFTELARGAMFGIGAGENSPELHHPDYDFPDALIAQAAEVFIDLVRECLKFGRS